MNTVDVNIQDLVPDPNNARKHNELNLKAIRGSIKKFGVVEPLVVRKANNQVIGGNGRLSVLKELGYTKAPVNYVDVDENTAIAMGAALNRTAELAEWDRDILGAQLSSLKEMDWDIDEFGFDISSFQNEKVITEEQTQEAETNQSSSNDKMVTCPNCKHQWSQ